MPHWRQGYLAASGHKFHRACNLHISLCRCNVNYKCILENISLLRFFNVSYWCTCTCFSVLQESDMLTPFYLKNLRGLNKYAHFVMPGWIILGCLMQFTSVNASGRFITISVSHHMRTYVNIHNKYVYNGFASNHAYLLFTYLAIRLGCGPTSEDARYRI